jgi:hypothetical protein
MKTALTEVRNQQTGTTICNLTTLSEEELKGIDLTDADLQNADLSGVDFHGRPLSDLYSDHPKPTHPNFTRANLTRANLSGARLCYADLTEANLSNANLERADFFEAVLAGADLRGANLTDAKLKCAFLRGARYDLNTKWPNDFLKKGQKLEHFGLVPMFDEAQKKSAQEREQAHRKHVMQEREKEGLCPLCGKRVQMLEAVFTVDALLGRKRQHRDCDVFKE